jgi:hypothetical protein
MANIFTLENFSDFSEKINIDDLYEKKRQVDLNKLELFKKILNRVHVNINVIIVAGLLLIKITFIPSSLNERAACDPE